MLFALFCRYVLYPATIVLTVVCSAGSRMRRSPIGAGRRPLWPPGTQATIGGCAPERIRCARKVLISEVAPEPPATQLGSSVVVAPACASKPPLKVGSDIAA